MISEHQEVVEVDDKSVITNTSSLFAEENSELRQKSNGKPEESEVSLKTKTTNETLSGSLAALKKAEDLSESAIANIRDLQNTLKDGVQNFRKQSTALSDLHHDGDFKHPNVKKKDEDLTNDIRSSQENYTLQNANSESLNSGKIFDGGINLIAVDDIQFFYVENGTSNSGFSLQPTSNLSIFEIDTSDGALLSQLK